MKLVLTLEEFSRAMLSVNIPALSDRKIASVDFPSRYSHEKDVTIVFEDVPAPEEIADAPLTAQAIAVTR